MRWTARLAARLGLACMAIVGGAGAAHAGAYRFSTVDVPGATFDFRTGLYGINNVGQAAGTAFVSPSAVGFTVPTGAGYTSIRSLPGADVILNGVNDSGLFVGQILDGSARNTAFVFSSGTVVRFDVPQGLSPQPGTVFLPRAADINNPTQIVGSYQRLGAPGNPFSSFSVLGGSFTSIEVPGYLHTVARSVNDAGTIVGYAYTGGGPRDPGAEVGVAAFSYAGGVYSTYRFPGDVDTYATGVNNAGDVVGYAKLTLGRDPGCPDCVSDVPFLYSGGVLSSLTLPDDVIGAGFYGINDVGQVVGFVRDAAGIHGLYGAPIAGPARLVAAVPEPAALLVFGGGLAALAFVRRAARA